MLPRRRPSPAARSRQSSIQSDAEEASSATAEQQKSASPTRPRATQPAPNAADAQIFRAHNFRVRKSPAGSQAERIPAASIAKSRRKQRSPQSKSPEKCSACQHLAGEIAESPKPELQVQKRSTEPS